MASEQYVRWIMRGSIDAGQSWSAGLSFLYDGSVGAGDLFAWLSVLGTPLTTWAAATGCFQFHNSASCSITSMSAVQYLAGATHAGSTSSVLLGSPIVGSSTVQNATQCAIVVSTGTGLASRHARGRFYMPATGIHVGTNNQMTSAAAGQIATATKTLINSIAAITLGTGATIPAVAVPGSTPPVPLINVSVDTRADVQRRRANKIVGTRSVVSL